jgi:hypothetical protein
MDVWQLAGEPDMRRCRFTAGLPTRQPRWGPRGGKAPAWLFGRMVLLSREILAHLVVEFGPKVRSAGLLDRRSLGEGG